MGSRGNGGRIAHHLRGGFVPPDFSNLPVSVLSEIFPSFRPRFPALRDPPLAFSPCGISGSVPASAENRKLLFQNPSGFFVTIFVFLPDFLYLWKYKSNLITYGKAYRGGVLTISARTRQGSNPSDHIGHRILRGVKLLDVDPGEATNRLSSRSSARPKRSSALRGEEGCRSTCAVTSAHPHGATDVLPLIPTASHKPSAPSWPATGRTHRR